MSPIQHSSNANENYSGEVKKIHLGEGDVLNVETGAMLACSNVEMQTTLNGSITQVAKRFFLGGEGLFQNQFKALKGGGWVAFEEGFDGQIEELALKKGEPPLILKRKAYLGSDPQVTVASTYAGMRGFFKGTGFGKIQATVGGDQPGRIFFSSPGGIVRQIKLTDEMGPILVDNDGLIAYTGNLKPTLTKLGGWKALFLSGEGFVNEFKGNGIIYATSEIKFGREDLLQTFLKFVMPDPIELVNKITVVALLAIIGFSPGLTKFNDGVHVLFKALNNGPTVIVRVPCSAGIIESSKNEILKLFEYMKVK